MRLLPVLATGCFVSSMAMRLIDPLVPEIARDLQVSAGSVALLASAFTFPYALFQPVLGSLGDALGKARIIKITLAVLVACYALATLVPSLGMLYVSRILAGAAAGGIIPLSFALVGDRFAFEERQVALSRLLTAILAGQLTGSIGSGLLASMTDWRLVLASAGALTLAALILTAWRLHPRADTDRPKFSASGMRAGYGVVLANPKARVCFPAVFVEGVVVFGFFPFIAVLLEERGLGGIREAGFVLAGFGIGGLVYTALVRALLPRIGVYRLIRAGGVLAGLGLAGYALGGAWPLQMLAFVVIGVGFYMIHNSLQTEATELAPGHRGAGVAAHAFFFFLGQAAGPVVYGVALHGIGEATTLLLGAVTMVVLAFITARGLSRIARDGAAREPVPSSDAPV
ncbi:MAG: MFS transporter [Hyphomicrobium sp.]